MIKDVANLLGLDEALIKELFNCGLIDPRSGARFLLVNDYKQMRKDNPEMTNGDIYFELSEKHNVSESTAYKWVNDYKHI